MLYPHNPEALHRHRLIVIGAAIALLLITLTTYAVIVHRSSPADQPRVAPDRDIRGLITVEPPRVMSELPALPPTGDPETFARQVAEAIFAWNTTTLLRRTDHIEQLVAVADPTGESTPGLVSDLDDYLPTHDAWAELADYKTRQWLSIGSVTTPSKWADAEAQAGGELLPGTAAFTIDGTRHRSGIWEDETVTSEHDVAFTVFIVCGPSYPECHLLRLSILDKPLA